MIAIGMMMNGFTVTHIAGQFRAGKPDGAIILAVRAEDDEHVVAHVEQSRIDDPAPAESWGNGTYFRSSDRARNAMLAFLDRSGLTTAYTVSTVRREHLTAQSTRSFGAWLNGRGPGEELSTVLRDLYGDIVGHGDDVRIMIERL